MTDAKRIVDMLSDPAFIQTYWGEKPKVFSATGLFEDAVNQHPTSRWLKLYAEISPNSVEYIFAGEHKPVNQSPDWEEGDIYGSIKTIGEKRTLILYDFHLVNEFYREVTKALSQKFMLKSSAGMFLATNQTGGLSKHRDPYGIFVFQHSGACFWKIWQGVDRRRIALKHELRPGEILYIPPGFPHEVRRLEKTTIHVTTAYHYHDKMEDYYLMLTENPLLSLAYKKHPGQWDRIVKIAEKRKVTLSKVT